jgi:hypothetical protein
LKKGGPIYESLAFRIFFSWLMDIPAAYRTGTPVEAGHAKHIREMVFNLGYAYPLELPKIF